MMLFSSFSIFGNKKVVFLSMYFKCMCVLNLFTKDDDNQLRKTCGLQVDNFTI